MSSEIYFNVASWFSENVWVKHTVPPPLPDFWTVRHLCISFSVLYILCNLSNYVLHTSYLVSQTQFWCTFLVLFVDKPRKVFFVYHVKLDTVIKLSIEKNTITFFKSMSFLMFCIIFAWAIFHYFSAAFHADISLKSM